MYRTKTNDELNAYKVRLDDKCHKLIDRKEKQYKVNDFIILTEEENLIDNPNGNWKWYGWVITGKQYKISMYHETECELLENNTYHPITWCKKMIIVNDKDEANKIFKEYVEFAKNF